MSVNNNVILMVGYPGSGKGTQGEILSEKLQIPHVSTGSLFRMESQSGSEIGEKMASFMLKGEIIPKNLTFPYIEKEFSSKKYQNGFLLDGYPKNVESYEHLVGVLAKNGLGIRAVLHFEVSRQEAKKRLTNRLNCNACDISYMNSVTACKKCNGKLESRTDDGPAVIDRRLTSFEQSTAPLLALYQSKGILRSIKAEGLLIEVTKHVLEALNPLPNESYFPFPPKAKENTSVFHNHIDAKNHAAVLEIVQRINVRCPESQSKIYPISHLHLGSQVLSSEFKSVYQFLPNFHEIQGSKDEAFATGKMGDAVIDYGMTLATLETVSERRGQGVMTEIEEELWQFEVEPNNEKVNVMLNRLDSTYAMDWTKLPGGWEQKMISKVPLYELHHGFDIPKKAGESSPPISLDELVAWMKTGFDIGGVFIFAKSTVWAYRTNEFSNEGLQNCKDRLTKQSHDLCDFVASKLPNSNIKNGSSLERVHAIWNFC